jgi:hypothetical protein
MVRGDKEGVLSLKMSVSDPRRLELSDRILTRAVPAAGGRRPAAGDGWGEELKAAVEDAVGRLLVPAMEREWWRSLRETAHEASVQVLFVSLSLPLPPLSLSLRETAHKASVQVLPRSSLPPCTHSHPAPIPSLPPFLPCPHSFPAPIPSLPPFPPCPHCRVEGRTALETHAVLLSSAQTNIP